MKRWLAAILLVILLGGGAAAWLGREALMARYYAHKLLTAADGDVPGLVEQAPTWGAGVADRLVDCLTDDDMTACGRISAALVRLAAEGKAATVAGRLADRFAALSPAGRDATLDCAAALVSCNQPEAVAACRSIVRPALQHVDAAVRARAATLALRPELDQADLLLPMLKDPAAEVRRTAILAVGPARALIADDDLLRWLHDDDAEVRRLTETALRSRGLRPRDIKLGRLLTDPRPAARLELLLLLRDDGELNLSAWLRRLSEDPAPAVRAAAARLADDQQVFQLAERLAQMTKTDPDLTVRQAAAYHLRQLQAPVRPVGAP
jgi:hypothetical protein